MAPAPRRPTVLVVDDDPGTRSLLAAVLRDEFGADVAEAGDADAGLAAARAPPGPRAFHQVAVGVAHQSAKSAPFDAGRGG